MWCFQNEAIDTRLSLNDALMRKMMSTEDRHGIHKRVFHPVELPL